jgi:hypothetical protein
MGKSLSAPLVVQIAQLEFAQNAIQALLSSITLVFVSHALWDALSAILLIRKNVVTAIMVSF